MVRVFLDTSWNSKNHVCYDPEKDVFFEVDDLRELPAEYDEIYLDSSLFPNMWPQLRILISNGRRVYYFTRPWKWKEIRERFKDDLKAKTGRVSKTDEGDAFLLWKVYELSLVRNNTHRYFKELTIVDVELRPLLMKEQAMFKDLHRMHCLSEIGVDVSSDVKVFEDTLRDIRREIVEKAINVIPGFIKVAEGLGLSRDDVNGLTGLAGLLVYLRFHLGFTSINKSINYLGIYRAKGRQGNMKKKVNRKAARYCHLLTSSILWKNYQRRQATLRQQRMVLKKLINLLRQSGSVVTEGGRVEALAMPTRELLSATADP